MTDYLRILWQNPPPSEPVELFYEVQPDRAVTRVVEVFEDGLSIADSLAIAATRDPNIANSACLCDGGFPRPEEYAEIFSGQEFSFKTITKSNFDALFLRSNVKS